MTDSRTVIGVDFGTANSYFAKSDSDDSQLILWHDQENTILETAVCYDEDKTVHSIGREAVEDYGASEEQEKLSLTHWFKPEITKEKEAAQATIDLIKAAIKYQKELDENIILFPENADVIIGVPAEEDKDKDKEFRKKLIECFKKAGLKQTPEIVSEPVGALITLLNNRQIDLRLSSEKILVVDIGGGTCDFTVFQDLKPTSWGDMTYGGRLFDDLFYQLFLKFHPQAEVLKTLSQKKLSYLHYYVCREEKHDFCKTINKQLRNKVSYDDAIYYTREKRTSYLKVGGSFTIRYSDFLEAAENYKPSDLMCNLFRSTAEKSAFYKKLQEMQEDGENLIKWFKKILTKKDNLKGVKKVILAGGSCRLPFVTEVISEEVNIEKDDLKPLQRPYELIAKGLVKLPEFRTKCDDIISRLRKSKSKHIDFLVKQITSKQKNYVKETAKKLTDLYEDNIFIPTLLDISKKSITSKKEFFEELDTQYQNRSNEYKNREIIIIEMHLTSKLQELVDTRTSEWLKEQAKGFQNVLPIGSLLPNEFKATVSNYKAEHAATGIGLTICSLPILQAAGVFAIFDGGASLTVVTGVGVALATAHKIPWVASKILNDYINKMMDDKKREKQLTKTVNQFNSSLSESLSKYLDQNNLKETLSNKIDNEIIEKFKSLSQAFRPENL